MSSCWTIRSSSSTLQELGSELSLFTSDLEDQTWSITLSCFRLLPGLMLRWQHESGPSLSGSLPHPWPLHYRWQLCGLPVRLIHPPGGNICSSPRRFWFRLVTSSQHHCNSCLAGLNHWLYIQMADMAWRLYSSAEKWSKWWKVNYWMSCSSDGAPLHISKSDVFVTPSTFNPSVSH